MKFKNITIKKVVFTIVIAVTLGMFVTGCDIDIENKDNSTPNTPVTENVVDTNTETDTEKLYKQVAENNARLLIGLAKDKYTMSLLESEPITSGNTVDLKVEGSVVSSGTWLVNTDNDGKVQIVLKDVVIDDYICNANDEEIECEKNN